MMATANFTSLLTTMPPIKLQKSIAGCYVTHASTFTSPLLAVPGSTWSSVSLLVSPPRPFAGEASLRCDNFKPLLTPTSPSITKTPTLLLGPPPQILSSENSNTIDGCSVDHESWWSAFARKERVLDLCVRPTGEARTSARDGREAFGCVEELLDFKRKGSSGRAMPARF